MGHDHAHGGGHDDAPKHYGRAFAIGISLNVAFVLVETAYGIAAGSVALIADAAHNLSDVLGLAFAWAAFLLAQRKPTRRHTYGLRKSTVLAALANSVLLLVTIGAVAWEAVGRVRHPVRVEAGVVMAVAAMGVAINTASPLFCSSTAARGTRTCAAPSCTSLPTLRCRSAWSLPARSSCAPAGCGSTLP